MNNSWDMENTSQVSNSAMEELQFQAGGFGAEYGNVNGGVVNTTTKTGGDTFSISGEYIAGLGDADASSDDGLYSYGYNLYNFNVGGPIGNGMKYFVSFEGRSIDDNDPSGAPHYMLDRDVIDWSGITKTEMELWEYDANGDYVNTGETGAYWEGDLMINGVAVADWQDDFFTVVGTASDTTEVHGLSQAAQDNLANTIAGIVADDPAAYGLDDYLSVDVTKVSHTDLAYNAIDNDDVIIAGYDNFRKEFGPAPNSGSDRMTVTGNLLFEYSGIRFKVGGLFNQEDGWNYVHEDRTATDYHDYSLVNNDHMPKFEQEAVSLYTNMTYALSNTSYIKLNLSTFNFTFEEGDSQHWDRVEDYGRITDDSYFTDWGNNPIAIEAFANFRGFGAIYNDYSINESKNFSIKADYLNQLDEHELKAGFDYRKTELKYYRVSQPLEIAKRYHDAELDGVATDNDWTYLTYMNAYTENIGYSITGDDSGFGYQDPGEPVIFGAYVQDKIELEDMIVNLGIRFDFFDSKNQGAKDWTNVWLDDGYVDYNPQQTYKDEVIAADGEAAFQAGLDDPNSEIYEEYMSRESGKFVDVDSESYFSPRIGFSFPVTDQTKLHAQYGKYTQHPVLNRLYLADSRLAANFTQGNQTVSPNPNLKPERTTQYEVGLTQQIGAFAALDITGFFKEIRDFTTMTNHEDGMRNGSPFVWAQYENGDFGIVNALQMALAEMGIERDKATIFSGIGCSGKTSHFINTYGVHTLHGRVLTFAQGGKLANPDMTVVAVGGDGDGLGIGAGHFVAAGRRNIDMTYIIFDNGVYGLTKGQASPTLKLGEKTKSLPTPNTNSNVNPIGLAVASGFTFVARGYSYDVRHLKDLIVKAVKHKGLSFLDVLQPCPTYNDVNTRDWYAGVDLAKESMDRHSRIYKLEDTQFDPTVNYAGEVEVNEKLSQALIKSLEWGDKIPTGVFYQNELVSPFSTRLTDIIPNYLENPPAKQIISDAGLPNTDISKILDSLNV